MCFDKFTILYTELPSEVAHPSKRGRRVGRGVRVMSVNVQVSKLWEVWETWYGHRGGITWYHHFTSKMSIESIEHDLRSKNDWSWFKMISTGKRWVKLIWDVKNYGDSKSFAIMISHEHNAHLISAKKTWCEASWPFFENDIGIWPTLR